MTTTEMTINEFCDRHEACEDGHDWAISTGCATMADLWRCADMRPDWRIWIATRRGVLEDTMLRLFACWCVRQVWHLVTDERSRRAVDVAVRYAVGTATECELADARKTARVAARVALYTQPAGRTGADAAKAAYGTADADAVAAAIYAARDASLTAWPDDDDALAAQAEWLFANAKPCFEVAQ